MIITISSTSGYAKDTFYTVYAARRITCLLSNFQNFPGDTAGTPRFFLGRIFRCSTPTCFFKIKSTPITIFLYERSFIWARVCLDIVREYLYFLKPFVHKNKQTIWTVAKFSKENRKSKIY